MSEHPKPIAEDHAPMIETDRSRAPEMPSEAHAAVARLLELLYQLNEAGRGQR